MSTPWRVVLAVGVVAVVVIVGKESVSRPPQERSMAAYAVAVCAGARFPHAALYDTTRPGVHRLAQAPPLGRWSDWSYGPERVRWSPKRLAEMELVLCFAPESVVVTTCSGYATVVSPEKWSTPEVRRAASDVTLAEERWLLRLLEARTGRLVDSLRVAPDSAACPRDLGESQTYFLVRSDDLGAENALRAWVKRYVAPGSPVPQ